MQYRIATNAGEPLKPLDEIASGADATSGVEAPKVTVEEGVSGYEGEDVPLPRTLVLDKRSISGSSEHTP